MPVCSFMISLFTWRFLFPIKYTIIHSSTFEFLNVPLSDSPLWCFQWSDRLCLLGAASSWLTCTRWPLRLALFLIYAVLLTPSLNLPPTTSPPFSPFSCSVLRGWGQWRMAQVAMTTLGALTARMASMEAVNSCVSSRSCPSKMTPVPATYSCFVGENN